RVQVMVRDLAQLGYTKVVKSKLKKDEKLLEKKNLSESEFKQAVNKVKKIVAASALMYLLSLEDVRSKTEVTVAGERGPVDILEFKEMREKIRMSLKRLPELNQEVMDLFYNQGLNQKTIAKKMKLSRPKVCRIIDKSVRYLQKELKHH
ncbi:MAG: sigma factor-like helix-turn-helix DNA-binding protein, partial [Candidatus Margulisiibacteriota bacterium]